MIHKTKVTGLCVFVFLAGANLAQPGTLSHRGQWLGRQRLPRIPTLPLARGSMSRLAVFRTPVSIMMHTLCATTPISTLASDSKELAEIPAAVSRLQAEDRGIRGSAEYNVALGDARAKAARDYLVNVGVAAAQLDTVLHDMYAPILLPAALVMLGADLIRGQVRDRPTSRRRAAI
jgi:hypothetical protein